KNMILRQQEELNKITEKVLSGDHGDDGNDNNDDGDYASDERSNESEEDGDGAWSAAEDDEDERQLDDIVQRAEELLAEGDLEGFSLLFEKNPPILRILDEDEIN